jgi:hypothetical protein
VRSKIEVKLCLVRDALGATLASVAVVDVDEDEDHDEDKGAADAACDCAGVEVGLRSGEIGGGWDRIWLGRLSG